MRLAAKTATLVTALVTGACTSAPTATPIATIKMGGDFQLKLGGVAQTADQALRLGFEAVKSDSRCPAKAQCVWAGEAVVLVWQQRGTGPKTQHELRLSPGAPHLAPPQALGISLVDLQPRPVVGRTVSNEAYVATFRLAEPGESDR